MGLWTAAVAVAADAIYRRDVDIRHRIVVLGAGTGGTLTANRLQRLYGDRVEIVVVDRDDRHVYQPGLLFVPFGLADPGEIVRSRRAQLRDGIEFRLAEVDRVETAAHRVHLVGGESIAYDVLVVASGASLPPEETEGLTGPGWGERIFTFYELASATALREALGQFDHGRLVVNAFDMPINARSRRWSSASWPIGTCASAACATMSS